MRKIKKVLAGILSAAMIMSSMTLTAFAAQTTTPATIDTDKKGSLTIHKYEYNGTEAIAGTGSENDENDKVPDEANPLAGAGFTIYKVADVNDLSQYYSTSPTDLPAVDNYVESGAIKAEYEGSKVGNEIVTGINGIAEFKDLELGFYVVIETTKPAAVTSAMKPFLVSVPMTTVDGADWLYDVHVYPKNGTKYGEVRLEKSGNNNVKLAGVTFVLQKQNADETWSDITKKAGAAGDNTGDDLTLTTNQDGIISVDGLTQGTYRFIETSVGNNNGYIMDGATSYIFVVTEEGTVTYNGTTAESVTISVNNEKPDMTKEVKDRTTGNWKQDSDYNVGDMIEYKVTVDVPKNITKLVDFNVTDTPTNLADDIETVALTCGDETVAINAYTVAKNGNGFTVTFVPAEMAAYAGKQIVITYKAELLSDALTTTEGNPNTAKLEYSNEIFPDSNDEYNPNTPENPNEKPGKDIIKDNAIIYTFKLTINKTGENNVKLADVEFDLYKEVTAETTGAAIGNSDNGLDAAKYWLKLETLTTNEEGTVSKSGLANGTYYLVETKTNDGYNLLKAPVAVELKIAYKTSMAETWAWTVDSVTGVKTLVKHEITTESTTFTNPDNTTGKEGVKVQNIVNKKGFTLPTTGGMGTLMFSIIGAILMIGGIVVLFRSNKRKTA